MKLTFGICMTTVGTFGGFTVEKDSIVPPRFNANMRVESPGICAMCSVVPMPTLLKTRSNFTAAVPGGRFGARHVGFDGRESSP